MRARVALFGWCVALLTACDSPSGPGTTSRRVAVGDTVAVTSASDSARTYSFVANAGTEYAVLFEVTAGSGILVVIDSATDVLLASVFASAADHGQWTANFSHAGVLLVRVQSVAQKTAPPFRFSIQSINRAPESRPARFTVGDTVTEAIDLVPDVDTFVAHGDAGQELVGWIEALNSSGVYEVNIIVLDPASGHSLGGTFHGPNDPNPHLAVLPPLAASGDYVFRVPALRQSGFPEYVGPYRFRFYAINRAPETATSTMPEGVIVSEALNIGGDIDEFTFPAAAGDYFNAFIRSATGFPISLVPLGQTEGGGPTVTDAADTSLFAHGTRRFKALTDGNLGLRVRGQEFRNAVGPYELYLYHVDPNPETTLATLTPGDTVATESIDLPGDLDEFTFTGSAGDQFNLFLSPLDPVAAPGLIATVRTPTDSVITLTQSASPPADFWSVSTGRFALPLSGTYRIRVDGPVGRYRLFLYPVNPAPETLSSTFVFGDSMSGEAIDVPGDVDEFSVTVAESSWASLVLTVGNDLTAGNIDAVLEQAGSGALVGLIGTGVPGATVAYAPFPVSPGSHVLRVFNLEGASPGRGSYEIRLYQFQDTAEAVSSTIALDDTINGEVLNPPGDFDRFYFYATRREHINVALLGLGPPSGGGVRAFLSDSGGGFPMAFVFSPAVGSSLDAYQTNRVDPLRDGWYRVMISAATLPLVSKAYRLAVTRTATTPEHTASAIAPGDSVVAEQIDYRGDWDEYTVTGAPGQHVAIAFESVFTTSGPWILVFDPATGDSLATEVGQGARLIPDLTIPAGGALKVAVFERPSVGLRECFDSTCNDVYRFTGAYKFRVIAVNIPPENAAAAYSVGDTVRGEAVAPEADIDEFTLSATPGQRLTVWWHLTAAPTPEGSMFQLRALDASTRAVLGGGSQALFGAGDFIQWFTFTVPPSGNVVIRVQGYDPGSSMGQAPYEFFIKP